MDFIIPLLRNVPEVFFRRDDYIHDPSYQVLLQTIAFFTNSRTEVLQGDGNIDNLPYGSNY